jgi:drug/metabolite transporter (DMT)-like permease
MREFRFSKREFRGIFFAMLACAAWGGSFLAPRALPDIDANTIACFRFLFFGISSGMALLIRRGRLPPFRWTYFGEAVVLSASGYSIYYLCLAIGVKEVGVPFATAIVGLLPLTVLIAATPVRKWWRYWVPALLLSTGAILLPAELFSDAYGALLEKSSEDRAVGLGASLAALGLWTFFAVRNAAFLRRHPEWTALEWAGVLGVFSGVGSGLFFFATRDTDVFLAAAGDVRLLVWTGFMGIVGAWGATALWNEASRALPAAFLGQLLVFEAAFGLFYGFLYEGRAPRVLEAVAIASLLCGAVTAMRKISQAER